MYIPNSVVIMTTKRYHRFCALIRKKLFKRKPKLQIIIYSQFCGYHDFWLDGSLTYFSGLVNGDSDWQNGEEDYTGSIDFIRVSKPHRGTEGLEHIKGGQYLKQIRICVTTTMSCLLQLRAVFFPYKCENDSFMFNVFTDSMKITTCKGHRHRTLDFTV